MPRALYLTHKEIYPVLGGDQVRFSQIASLLADSYDVDTVSLTHDPTAQPAHLYDPRLSADSRVIYVPPLRRYMRAARTAVNRLPEFVNHYRDPALMAWVRDRAADYDLILCGSAAMAQYADRLGHPAAYLDMTDSMALNNLNASRTARALHAAMLRDQCRRMTRYEARCRDAFRGVAYISEVDRTFVGRHAERTAIVSNWVDIPDAPPAAAQRAESAAPELLFVGRMSYRPNIEAVQFMAARLPEGAHLTIAGAAPSPEVVALESDCVHVTGRVAELSAFFRSADLVVAPMLSGSGIQNKILQAMAHGCCVLTTPIGADGLDTSAGAFAVAVPDGFAAAAAALLADPARRAAIGESGRAYVESHFSRSRVAEQFARFISL